MLEKTDISEIIDGEDEIVLIELSQAQYDAYKREAEEIGADTHEYIELALKHEQMTLNNNSESIVEAPDEENTED